MYAGENKDRYPRVQGVASFVAEGTEFIDLGLADDCSMESEASIMSEPTSLYPDYITDLKVYFCPSDPEFSELADPGFTLVEDKLDIPPAVNEDGDACPPNWVGRPTDPDQSYQYLGYVMDRSNQGNTKIQVTRGGTTVALVTQLAAFLGAADDGFNALLIEQDDTRTTLEVLDDDLDIGDVDMTLYGLGASVDFSGEGTAGGDVLYRLRDGVARLLITDVNNAAVSNKGQSEIAIMWDNTSRNADDFNHIPGGQNVLYMDGHVEFLRYPNDLFPANKNMTQFFFIAEEEVFDDHPSM